MPGFKKAHIERRWSTGANAANYCKKDGFFYEWGTLRNSINGPLTRKHQYAELFRLTDSGATDDELIAFDAQLWDQCQKSIAKRRMRKRPVLDAPREIILYFGETGLGKTRAVYDAFPDLYEVNVDKTTWYDGYDGQETVLYDEFSGQMPIERWKKLFDNYYVRSVPIKYGFVWFNPRRIILTSNHHPRTWWDFNTRHNVSDELAVRRRFTHIYLFERSPLGNVIVTRQDVDTFWPVLPRAEALPNYKGDSRSGLFDSPQDED